MAQRKLGTLGDELARVEHQLRQSEELDDLELLDTLYVAARLIPVVRKMRIAQRRLHQIKPDHKEWEKRLSECRIIEGVVDEMVR